jgi:hypothetical protein
MCKQLKLGNAAAFERLVPNASRSTRKANESKLERSEGILKCTAIWHKFNRNSHAYEKVTAEMASGIERKVDERHRKSTTKSVNVRMSNTEESIAIEAAESTTRLKNCNRKPNT